MIMAKLIDLTGNKYGRLTVIELDKTKKYHWICKCDCGSVRSYGSARLKDGTTQSCGCLRDELNTKRQLKDLTGFRFGKWYVIKRDLTKKSDRAFWVCRCDCGTEKSVSGFHLRSGCSTSCGCIKSPDLTGQRFGKLTVLELLDRRSKDYDKIYRCICDCGSIKETIAYSLTSGATKSCGCIKSLGELKIKEILNNNNIDFKYEYSFEDYRSARYDFAIIDKNENIIKLIEFDGQQHFEESRGSWNKYTTLQERVQKDREKDEYALSKSIKLTRIPYWEIENITLEMLLE